MSVLRSCVVAMFAALALAAPAAAADPASTMCPQSTSIRNHPDAQRAGDISARWHTEIPGSVGDQYSGHGLDQERGGWFVGYAPGPLDAAAVRDRVLALLDRHAGPEDAAWMRDHLTLDPQRYREADLRDVQTRLAAKGDGGRFGSGWLVGVSCLHGDVRRAELEVFAEDSTPAQQEEARRAAEEFGDRAIVVVRPGYGARPNMAPVPTCPLITPVPPPVEGRRGFVFVDQFCRAGERVEDFDVTTDFGDGTRIATPFRADGLWLVGGEHAYRRAGRYLVTSEITDRRTGVTSSFSRLVEIKNAPLSRRSVARPSFPRGRAARRVVAAFTDGNALALAADHRAIVRWGDGTKSKGTVRRVAPGRFEVLGRHRYSKARTARRVTVRIDDRRGAVLTVRTPLARAR